MDDELKLVEELDAANAALASLAAYGEDALLVPVSLATRAIAKAAATIARLHAEIEALKSDVDELVRAGSDEATENERLVKERDEANVRVRAITEVLNFSAEQTQKAEAQRDAAYAALRPFAAAFEHGVTELPDDWAVQTMRSRVGFYHFGAASRALEGGEG